MAVYWKSMSWGAVHFYFAVDSYCEFRQTKKAYGFFIFHTPFGEIFGFVGSSLVRIGFLPFGIYKTLVQKLSLKMPKSLEKSRLFGGASFLFPFYGRDDRTRTCGILVPNQARYQTSPHPELYCRQIPWLQMESHGCSACLLLYFTYGGFVNRFSSAL